MHDVSSMLSFLSIPHNKKNSFWVVNEAELDYLYDDFIKASKSIKCQLHPDHGGNEESFARFSKHCAMVANTFQNHGIGPQKDAITRLQEREDRVSRAKAKALFKRTGGKH